MLGNIQVNYALINSMWACETRGHLWKVTDESEVLTSNNGFLV